MVGIGMSGPPAGYAPISAHGQVYSQLLQFDGTEAAPANVIHVDAFHP